MSSEEDAADAPLMEGGAEAVIYCDDIDFVDVMAGNVRLMAWRWKRIAGELVREPVAELITPESAAAQSRARIDRAYEEAKRKAAGRSGRRMH